MVTFLNLPSIQYPRNAMLDFSGVNDALKSYTEGMDRAYMGPHQLSALQAQTEHQRLQSDQLREQTAILRRHQELVNELLSGIRGRGGDNDNTTPPPGTTQDFVGGLLGTQGGVNRTPGDLNRTLAANLQPPPGRTLTEEDRTRLLIDPRGMLMGGNANALLGNAGVTGDERTLTTTENFRPPPDTSLEDLNRGLGLTNTAPPLGMPNNLSPGQQALRRWVREAPDYTAGEELFPLDRRSPPSAAGPTGGMALRFDPMALLQASRRQTQPLPSGPPPGVSFETPTANVPPPAPPPGNRQPPNANAPGQGGMGGAFRNIFANLTQADQLAAMLSLIKQDYTGLANILRGVTPGTEAVDRKFAEEFAGWTAGGGYADVQRQLAQLMDVERNLASGDTITGGITGSLPDWINRFVNPQVVSNRQRVEEVVQRSLRQILGAQFTEQEATRLIARAYDPTLPQEENLRRVRALLTQIALSAEARQSSADYFRRHGTLRGFQGRTPNLSDFTSLYDTNTNAPPGNDGFSIRRLN